MDARYIRTLDSLTSGDVALVGGKNASLGELLHAFKETAVRVPPGFATTADAYREFLEHNGLREKIEPLLAALAAGTLPLEEAGASIRRHILHGRFPPALDVAIREAYRDLCWRELKEDVDVAVRSSATAEDLPEASFAGQQESFLNVSGEGEVLEACRRCFASLFTDRAISYRAANRFEHLKVALSVGVQRMVRADRGGAGVMFSIDTESGFPDVVLVNAAWGLGENVVKGKVIPDQYLVFKPLLRVEGKRPLIEKRLGDKAMKLVYAGGSRRVEDVKASQAERQSFVLSDDEILRLAGWAVLIEQHYGRPMDLEWAKDGDTGELFILQARPETVHARRQEGRMRTYRLKQKGRPLVTGLSIGSAVARGKVSRVLDVRDIDTIAEGSILVTEMTDPDWGPALKRVAGIVTDAGGRTCHAAIVSRELGVPAIVGAGTATQLLADGQEVTLSCAGGEQGVVYEGLLPFEVTEETLDVPPTRTKVMMNIASPDAAFQWWRLPVDGIGLARMEFIISGFIKAHPMALLHPRQVKDPAVRQQLGRLAAGYDRPERYFVEQLAQGIAKIAASRYPAPVIVRTSDFKTNEYAGLLGGADFEPREENPMLGWRGASRYYSEGYREGFALECEAIRLVREEMGFSNVIVMIPFCRTLDEADRVLETMASCGLKRGENGLEVYVMCEIPSNAILADRFAQRFDGFSIGSNDLTQLVLGVDRDSGQLAGLFDERDDAVQWMIRRTIEMAHRAGRKVGICGQAPSDYPDFVEFLVQAGIDSISLNPDSVLATKRWIAQVEALAEAGTVDARV